MASIEKSHAFTATHRHMVPGPEGKAILCEAHDHDWTLTVRLEGPLHPTYGWVMDFGHVGQLLAEATAVGAWCSVENPTAERLLDHFVKELAWQLQLVGEGVLLTWATLQEDKGSWAVHDPEKVPTV